MRQNESANHQPAKPGFKSIATVLRGPVMRQGWPFISQADSALAEFAKKNPEFFSLAAVAGAVSLRGVK